MIKVSIVIERPINVVWDYFTKIENWSKWYDGGLKEVVPGWQNGGKLFWALGGSSPISNIIPLAEICISGSWMDTTYKFSKIGNNITGIEIIESDPKGGAVLKDGGAANKAQWEKTIQKLKACIERETKGLKSADGQGETLEQAYAMAELKIPNNSTIIERKVISEPVEKTMDIELEDDQTVERKFKLNWGNYKLKNAALKSEGKKGFLGIGKKMKEYTITYLIPGIVRIEFQDNPD
jgi:hypothetical protein